MARDGYGMPVPDGGSPLPWSANERRDERTNERRVDDYDGVRVAGVWDDDDSWFILHAANNIIPARDIVRRRAMSDEDKRPYPAGIAWDGVHLWENQAMSDESELARLRADLEAMERYEGRMYALAAAKAEIRNKIAKLEADADPWREAKGLLIRYRGSLFDTGKMVAYSDHLAAENARLTERVAELEDVKPIADMQPPFEGPIVGIEPVLDHARVLATACGIMEEQGWIMNDRVREELKCGAKPYPLKKGGE